MPRRTRIQMVGKQVDRDLDKERKNLRQLLWQLRWEWRHRQTIEAAADEPPEAGPDEPEGCA